MVESTTSEQVIGIAAGGQPVVERKRVGGVLAQFVASVIDPLPETLPLTEQRFMGDLDGERTRESVAVADQKSVRRERLHRCVHGDGVDVEG